MSTYSRRIWHLPFSTPKGKIVKKPNPFEKADKKADKKAGVKEGSPKDKAMDKKAMPAFMKKGGKK